VIFISRDVHFQLRYFEQPTKAILQLINDNQRTMECCYNMWLDCQRETSLQIYWKNQRNAETETTQQRI